MTTNAFQNTRRYERDMEEFLQSDEVFTVVMAPVERLRSYKKIVKRRGFPMEVSLIRVDAKDRICWIKE